MGQKIAKVRMMNAHPLVEQPIAELSRKQIASALAGGDDFRNQNLVTGAEDLAGLPQKRFAAGPTAHHRKLVLSTYNARAPQSSPVWPLDGKAPAVRNIDPPLVMDAEGFSAGYRRAVSQERKPSLFNSRAEKLPRSGFQAWPDVPSSTHQQSKSQATDRTFGAALESDGRSLLAQAKQKQPTKEQDLKLRADPAFRDCVLKHGDDLVKSNLSVRGFRAAQAAATNAGIDTAAMLALWANENGLLDGRYSPKAGTKEVGPAQVRPIVVAELNRVKKLPKRWYEDQEANLTAGGLYYRRLLDHYRIPEEQAAAAYNAGPSGHKKSKAGQEYQATFTQRRETYQRMLECMKMRGKL